MREAIYQPPAAGAAIAAREIQLGLHARVAADSRLRSTSAARNGSFANTITRCKAAAWSSRWWACQNDGPSDAAVVRPVLGSRRGLVDRLRHESALWRLRYLPHGRQRHRRGACATASPSGPIRRRSPSSTTSAGAIANGPKRSVRWSARPWPATTLAVALGTPFISGKDSLNNEFRYTAADGSRRSIAIPPSLLISAMGQIDDVSRAVTMDLKSAGNLLYQVGQTKDELGGSHFALVENLDGGQVPQVDAELAPRQRSPRCIGPSMPGWCRACHDLSEGGLAAAAAEMAFAGDLGARLSFWARCPRAGLDASPPSTGELPGRRRGRRPSAGRLCRKRRRCCCSANRIPVFCAKSRPRMRRDFEQASGRVCRTPWWARWSTPAGWRSLAFLSPSSTRTSRAKSRCWRRWSFRPSCRS